MLISILTTLAQKLPLAFLERWLTYLEKKNDSDTQRLRDILSAEVEARKLQTQVLIAEQQWWATAIIRPLIAWPIGIYIWKVVVWDKVLGWGVTDPLTGGTEWVMTAVVTAYFLARPIEKAVRSGKVKSLIEGVMK